LKLLEGVSEIERESSDDAPVKTDRKLRLLTLDDLDKRTRAAQFARDTRDRVCADLGGVDNLTTLEAILCDNVAVNAAMLTDMKVRWLRGDDVDGSVVATLQNCFNRTAAALGIGRRAKDIAPNLKSYLEGRGRKPA
jgi:hypothetical protein